MHVLDAGDRFHGGSHVRRADAWRGRFQQHLHRFLENRPGSPEDRADDQQAHERIENGPSRQENRAAADDHAERDPRISQHVPERTANIEVVFRSLLEQQGNGEVGDETDRRDHHNPSTVDGNRLQESLEADDRDTERGQ